MTAAVYIHVNRALHLAGRCLPAGAVVAVTPDEAAAAVDSGRAELAHAEDAPIVEKARRAELDQTLRALGRHPARPPADPRWIVRP